MEKKEETVAVRRSSSEQRKLRSRDAARCRRSQETEVFYELAHTLPLPRRVSTHLDKAAIMRVTLSFLRMHHLLASGENQKEESEEEEEEEEEEEDPMDAFYPQALAGFIMVMTEEGDLIYLTENVSRHIGITQLELLGQSVYDFVHPCDQEELRDLLAPRPGLSKKSTEQRSERNFFLRMKSTLTSRGRTVNIKSATWKVLHCTGHMCPFGGSSTSPPAARVMTLLCEPIPHPSSVEFPLDTCTFLTRHSMDLRFTHCEGRVTELVGYKPDDLIGRSAYEFHHALDSDHVNKSLHTLLSKGQVSTSHYRFLANSGGFVWAETQATVLYSSKTSQPEAVVCLNFILSAVEQPDIVFSVEQTRCGQLHKSEPPSPQLPPEDCETAAACDSDGEQLASSSQTEDAGSSPSSAANLFFKLKEPEELLQLAPEAGDAVVPLTGGFVELSFISPPSPNSLPDHPQDLCTPQLRQLLTPIFNPITPPSSSSPASSPDPEPSIREEEEEEEEEMDTSKVEKFFAIRPEEGQKTEETLENMEGMDLDMLAPYISMDDDFQLTFLSSLPEEADKASSSSPEPSAVSRKRTHNPDEELPSQLMVQDKRQKQEPSSIEEELLLSHRLLDCLEETNQSDLILDPGPGGRSQLLTDRDPILGGIQGLCDTAALMRDIFVSRPPDLSPPLSPMT
ncbi:hypoxia-inducible factor 3-alpha-like isoform X2 [Seriola lalandi dorsalis]|uniref:hypoxia inducible factor 1 subunit alpha, like n=1 Tax=Seriola aureovittata TaxID=2871759 RepID=UPI000C6F57E1|nr:hypoxia-inducible factor 3-alpha-like isoform X2 [Seriola lalandi dorsalis]XP_056229761.1 hypoxia inducible factor 1 subunit alpha, like [Seriola aureovittata]